MRQDRANRISQGDPESGPAHPVPPQGGGRGVKPIAGKSADPRPLGRGGQAQPQTPAGNPSGLCGASRGTPRAGPACGGWDQDYHRGGEINSKIRSTTAAPEVKSRQMLGRSRRPGVGTAEERGRPPARAPMVPGLRSCFGGRDGLGNKRESA